MINGKYTDTLRNFPKLYEVLQNIPELRIRNGQVKFSRITSGTKIRPHAGPEAARLRMHCTLESPPTEISESWIRVRTKKYSWWTGECIVFDETCEHEVFFS
jgi:aspartyl/asparaginyl beta-hydroxylase (cupin superfamily)